MRNIQQKSCSVIPQHMMRQIAEHGDDDARETVASTLQHTALIARERVINFIKPPARKKSSGKKRSVYDAQNLRILPGVLVMNETRGESSDVEVNEAFAGAGAMYDFLAKIFLRDSIDGKGMPLNSSVHYGAHFDNAMWNGKQMIYGDGDGKLFTRFTAAIDVIGHEHAHGITQHDAGLIYQGQPGALNEHISDVFGIMLKQYYLSLKASQSDWLIGKGLFGPTIKGQALRSMKAPGTAYDDPILGRDPQPSHMRDYVNSADDNGGVHINSGIPNNAFYRVATEVGGYTWSVAGRIWYEVVQHRLSPESGFQDFANATVSVAGEIFGAGGQVQTAVTNAWSKVGLAVPPSTAGGGVATATPVAIQPQIPAAPPA
jgi:Zn-dependent metalloprotease